MSFILSLTDAQHKFLKYVLENAEVPDDLDLAEGIMKKLNKEPKQTKITNIVTGSGGVTISVPTIEN